MAFYTHNSLTEQKGSRNGQRDMRVEDWAGSALRKYDSGGFPGPLGRDLFGMTAVFARETPFLG